MSNTISINSEDYVLTFADEFNSASAQYWNGFGNSGVWATSFSPHLDDTRWSGTSMEQQYYVDPDDTAFANPFSISGGSIEINAAELTTSQQVLADGQEYSSGLLTTEMTFATSSGYVEIRADIPDEQGLWSAFWLLPIEGGWDSEIDIAEILGSNTDGVHTNIWDDGTPDETIVATEVGDGYHTYGLLWTDTTIEWQIDGITVRTSSNTVDSEMFLAIGLAVGGWDGDPDATTDFDDGLKIDYVRVYELESDPDRNDAIPVGSGFLPKELHDGTAADDILNGSKWSDTLHGFDGNDTIYGKKGDDVLEGNAGDDELYGHEGDDTLLGGEGKDKLVGGLGADRLTGGVGDDHLWGGKYSGDAVADVFVFNAGDGKDFIHDFSGDLIDLTSFDVDWAAVSGVIADVGWAMKLSLTALGGSAGDLLYLIGVDASELTESSFILADPLLV